jgi:hypothetical protein
MIGGGGGSSNGHPTMELTSKTNNKLPSGSTNFCPGGGKVIAQDNLIRFDNVRLFSIFETIFN